MDGVVRHIIWDWNGTLFNDIDAVVDATNVIFAPYRLPALDADTFRAVYTRPIWVAYERLLDRPLTDDEWHQLDDGFHEHYHELMLGCGLAADARDALDDWQHGGGTQSLLSMWMHERLVPTVHRFGIDTYFTRVDGLRGVGGGPKAEWMAAHIDSLSVQPGQVLVIGDSVDDIHAAQRLGARAVGFTGGVSTRAALEATGVPVVDTLREALDHS